MSESTHSSGAPLLTLHITLDNPAIAALAKQLCQAVEKTITTHLSKLEATVAAEPPSPAPRPSVIVPEGVELPGEERLKAVDLRTALLLGKIPEDSGILIDGKATAKLLNIAHRTLYRLLSMGAMPEPVKLVGKMKRWRLAEILEWVDSDCPPQKHWNYPNVEPKRRPKGR